MAERINQNDLVKVYKHMLLPMGYNVVPIPEKAEQPSGWKPSDDDVKNFEAMNTIQVEQAITEFEAQLSSIQKRMDEIQVKTFDYLNGQNPTSLTKELYVVPHQLKPTVSKNSIIVTSDRVEEIKKTIMYLEVLKETKLNENLLDNLKKIDSAVTGIKIEKKSGTNSRVELKIK